MTRRDRALRHLAGFHLSATERNAVIRAARIVYAQQYGRKGEDVSAMLAAVGGPARGAVLSCLALDLARIRRGAKLRGHRNPIVRNTPLQKGGQPTLLAQALSVLEKSERPLRPCEILDIIGIHEKRRRYDTLRYFARIVAREPRIRRVERGAYALREAA